MPPCLLLVSNSTQHGSGYLDHCADEIVDLLGPSTERVLFIPYARPGGISHDEYAAKARERIEQMGYQLDSVHTSEQPAMAVKEAEAIFIGGGNTFVLLDELYKNELIEPIRRKVLEEGLPYIGTSAGSNVATPSLMTTNDMPIRQPPGFAALGLVPFQINPHYLDPDPGSQHQGETRERRLKEYLVFNDTPVIALREGSMLRIEDQKMWLKGTTAARVFRKGREPEEFQPVCGLDWLLS